MRHYKGIRLPITLLILAAVYFALVVFFVAPARAQSVDPLTRGVEQALDGKEPPPEWRNFCGAKVQRFGERGSPSANWPTLACGIAYIRGETWARGWWLRYLREARDDGRLWGKEPGLFLTLERSVQVLLLAEHRLLTETPEQRKKNAAKAKRAEFDRRMRRIHG